MPARTLKNKEVRSSILLIYTGGTIGMRPDPATGTLVPFDFNDIYEEFPSVRSLGVDIDTISFTPIDSSNVTPELWVTLARMIEEKYDAYDGFVVLHGTDTMSYTASALSFMLENLAKPVVFTGSQIPIGVMRTDGRENLITSIEIAAARLADGRAAVPEVSLYFQNRLFRANRTTKHSAEDLNAFRSYNYPALAEVGVKIIYNRQCIHYPDPSAKFSISTGLEEGVMVVKIFPGMTDQVFASMLSTEGVRGVVLETYGAGNAPTTERFLQTVGDAVARGVTIMDVTQCSRGSVAMELYETGAGLQNAGVISGRDSTTEAAVTKLMCLLGSQRDPKTLDEMLRNPICGEISL